MRQVPHQLVFVTQVPGLLQASYIHHLQHHVPAIQEYFGVGACLQKLKLCFVHCSNNYYMPPSYSPPFRLYGWGNTCQRGSLDQKLKNRRVCLDH